MWTALLVGVLCNNIIGMLWYSPLMFLNVLVETTHLDPTKAEMTTATIVASNILVYIISPLIFM
jgi:hypothetical protein